MPLPPNDPRRKDKSTIASTQNTAGKQRGVGYRLLPGTRTFRADPINLNSHPLGNSRMGEAGQTNISVAEAGKRWPRFELGHRIKTPDQFLIGLWQAKMIPGLSPADHDLFDGIPTAEEWYDMAFSEDQRVLSAWQKLNSSPTPLDPLEFDITSKWGELDDQQKKAVEVVIEALLA